MSVNLVNLADIPQYGIDLYGVIDRNKHHLQVEQDTSIFAAYSDSDFRRAISSSIEGTPLVETGLQTDFSAIVEEDIVVGGIIVCTAFDTYQRRRLSFFVDIEGGKARKGFASNAVKQKVAILEAEDDVEIIEAICSKPNAAALKVLERAGLKQDNTYRQNGFRRMSLVVDVEAD